MTYNRRRSKTEVLEEFLEHKDIQMALELWVENLQEGINSPFSTGELMDTLYRVYESLNTEVLEEEVDCGSEYL